jgi:hypothetical protein
MKTSVLRSPTYSEEAEWTHSVLMRSGCGEASDQRQLDFAAKEKRCLVTRNRDDFIRPTVRFFNDRRPHCGVLIVPYTLPGDQFSRIASLIRKCFSRHEKGLAPYSIAFLPIK